LVDENPFIRLSVASVGLAILLRDVGVPAHRPRSVSDLQPGGRPFRCRKAGVRYIRVHDTRRTCASLLVALDVHPRVAMQILRHSQIAMTMEIYSEVPTAKTRSALKRLGRQLDG
jgi:hypothetical protein